MPRKIIYLTHCSAKKNPSLRSVNKRVTPDNLYTATPTQRFMERCIMSRVNWAIFSDKYGIWFSYERNAWYEKNPLVHIHSHWDHQDRILRLIHQCPLHGKHCLLGQDI
jgi:hypothetical protein